MAASAVPSIVIKTRSVLFEGHAGPQACNGGKELSAEQWRLQSTVCTGSRMTQVQVRTDIEQSSAGLPLRALRWMAQQECHRPRLMHNRCGAEHCQLICLFSVRPN